MWVCFKKFCFWIPIYYLIPVIKIPDPDPGPYRGFMVDATILATINEAARHITDATVRQSLHDGIAAGMKGMQAKAGADFTMSFEAPRQ
jgi:hypothetical protein